MAMNEGMSWGPNQIEIDILREGTYLALAEKQAVLDNIIKKKQGIEELKLDRIELAYLIEVGECTNEMKGDVKYWSQKPPNREKFLEELADALHFMLSYSNHAYVKKRIGFESYGSISKCFDQNQDYIPIAYEDEPWAYALKALRAMNIEDSFSCLLILAHRYGYTEQELVDAYDTKYEENFRRIASGVY